MKSFALVIGGMFCFIASIFSQTFPCEGQFFLSLKGQADLGTSLYQMRKGADGKFTQIDTLIENSDRVIDPIGYRIIDEHLYGIDLKNWDLLRIQANGELEKILELETLIDTTYEYHAGAILPNRDRFILIGRDKQTQRDLEIFFVKISDDGGIRAGRNGILSTFNVRLSAIAFDPIYGSMIGFDENRQSLAFVDWQAGTISDYAFQTVPEVARLGALFFDQEGELWGYGGGGLDQSLYQINKTTGAMVPVQGLGGSELTDGCSCPYSVALNKSIEPQQTLICEEVRIEYEIDQKLGLVFQTIPGVFDMFLRDTLPGGLLIKEVNNLPFGADLLQGPGGNILDIKVDFLLVGKNSIEVVAEVLPEAEPLLFSQARLLNLPPALGAVVRSDDPSSPEALDATSLAVIPLDLTLPEDLDLCFDKSTSLAATLSLEGVEIDYLWSTGATTAEIDVDQAGTYWVEASARCGTVRDSIEVRKFEEALSVSLGEDLEIPAGLETQVVAVPSREGTFSATWQVEPLTVLGCEDCLTQRLAPLEDTRLSISLLDENGCAASDELLIGVDNEFELFTADVLTPNGDGINERFFVQGKGLIALEWLAIHDRWGRRVFLIPKGN